MFRQAPKLGKRILNKLYHKLTVNPQVFASTEIKVYFGKSGLSRFEQQLVQTGRPLPTDLLPAETVQKGVAWEVWFPNDAVDTDDLPLGWHPERNQVVINGSELAIYLLRQGFSLTSYPRERVDPCIAAGQLTLASVLG